MKTIIPSVKGTRDFYPEDMAVRTWLYNKLRKVSESFGYQEYEGPILEKIDLYAAKSGEELVKEQAFVFNDRGGELITLRPELTPTLARMVAQKQNELVFPLRWWSFGPFWRYERPQKGRTREFFQWNIDLFGATSTDVDAELIAIAASFFKEAGLDSDKVKIAVNDRRLMDASIKKLGVSDDNKKAVFRLIDRQDKMSLADWRAYGLDLGLTENQVDALRALMDNRDLWKESVELTRVFDILNKMGFGDYIQYDARIIRGLEYYTGTVFEARDASGEGRAVLGGGHYDNLVADVGGAPLAGIGFAMGDVMISVLLKKYDLIPGDLIPRAPVLVTVFDESRVGRAYAIASQIRQSGLTVVCYPESAKLPKQFKYADRIGARFVIVEGPEEEAGGLITLKDLKDGSQQAVKLEEIVLKLNELLAH
ncbi:MAG: histidine--tRNA ligase [Anaerolineae bacterium]|nr:histidine--tRNA ligase [Anaerolineae bacterium]